MTDAATKQLAELLQLPINTVKAVLVLQPNRLAMLRLTTTIMPTPDDAADAAQAASTQTQTFDLVPRKRSSAADPPSRLRLTAVPSSAFMRSERKAA